MTEDEINAEAAKWYDSYAGYESEEIHEDWWEEYEEYMRWYNGED